MSEATSAKKTEKTFLFSQSLRRCLPHTNGRTETNGKPQDGSDLRKESLRRLTKRRRGGSCYYYYYHYHVGSNSVSEASLNYHPGSAVLSEVVRP